MQYVSDKPVAAANSGLLSVFGALVVGSLLSIIAAHIYAPLIAPPHLYMTVLFVTLMGALKYVGKVNATLLLIFAPFGGSIFIQCVIQQNFEEAVKYGLLFAFLSVLAKRQNWPYLGAMVRVNLVILVVSIISFVLYESLHIYLSLQPLDQLAPFVKRAEWHYALVNYSAVIAQNDGENSLLGIGRMFGLSTEPSLFAIWCWVNFALAMLIRYHRAAMLFLAGFVLAFSYGAMILVIGSLFFSKTKYSITFKSLAAIGLIAVILNIYSTVRGQLYLELLSGWISVFASGDGAINSISVPYGFLSFISSKGVVVGFCYLISCLALFIYSRKVNAHFARKNLWLFVSTLLVCNKAGEPFSPFILIFFAVWWLALKRDKAEQVSFGANKAGRVT